MTELRVASTDADYEAWRTVRQAVMPYERTATVAEMRAMDRPERTLLLAERDGVVVGSGVVDRSSLAGRSSCMVRVLPGHRRQGIGTLLLRDLAERAVGLGQPLLGSGVDEPESLAFALHHGFAEVDRQVEQLRAIGAEPYPAIPEGLEIVTVADRPELWPVAYRDVAADAVKDMAVVSPLQLSLSEWEREWINAPQASFLGLVDGAVVGLASLHLDEDVPDRAEQGFTAVRREFRGRGIAAALKRVTLWWAAEHGIREVYTWTQNGNENMRQLNEHLGFRYGHVSIDLIVPLPLPAPSLPAANAS